MKGKERYQIWLTLGTFCVFVILPCVGYGADLSIGNTLSTNGDLTVNGTVSATSFSGDGSGLTNVPSSQIGVYDANGQFLGTTLGFPEGALGFALVPIAGTNVAFTYRYVSPTTPLINIPTLKKQIYVDLINGWISNGTFSCGPFYFESTDCTGTVYASPIASYRIIQSFSSPPPTFTFFTGNGQPGPHFIQSYSGSYPASNCFSSCSISVFQIFPFTAYLVGLSEVPQASLPFTIPFALPLEYRAGGTN